MSRVAVAVVSVLLGLAALPCCSSTTTAPAGVDPHADADAAVDPGADAGAEAGPACPTFGTPATLTTLASAAIDESSGLAASSRNPDVYWVHNDSGDSARAFAVGKDGELLTILTFDTTKPVDIEDMAIEDESPERSYLYFADTGDNDLLRKDVIIHRVEEPGVGAATVTSASAKMTVRYPDGPHDAETLLFDPVTKDLLLATKVIGAPSAIHRIGPFVPGGSVTTSKIAEVDVALATGGEISRDGLYIGIRNYGPDAFIWIRKPGESLAAAFARPPCLAPVADEKQGESLAFTVGTRGFATISEGKKPELHVTPFE
ncbi:MAG: hypothetical protein JWP97_2827 [Labilithrix sp.]|nr:hypothetical protein [Labilithrix sp.]